MLPSAARRPARGAGDGEPAGHNASTMPDTTIIATRESRLALWQAEHVRDLLARSASACAVELLGMTTRGDQILDRALSKVGGKGLFVKELETALEDGRAAPRRAFAEGRADGPAGRLRARPRCSSARTRATPSSSAALRDAGRAAAGRAASAPRACAASSQLLGAAPRPAHRAAARQPRHAPAQARRRRLRRHRAGRRRAEAAGPGARASARCFEPAQMLPAAGQGALGIEVRADAAALRERAGRADRTARPGWRCMPSAPCRARSAAAAACRWPRMRCGTASSCASTPRSAIAQRAVAPAAAHAAARGRGQRRRGQRARRARRGAAARRRRRGLSRRCRLRRPAGRVRSPMRVIVTRPAAAGRAAGWPSCAARGIDAVALPLIEIAAGADPQPLQQAWRDAGRRWLW